MKAKNTSELLNGFTEYGRLNGVKIIDTHTHMGDIYGTSLPVSGIDDCVSLMDEENIQSIWCSAHGDLFSPAGDVNRETKAVMQRYPDRVRGYYVFNPNQKELYLSRINETLNIPGYIGLKLLPNYHNYSLDGGGYAEALEFADKHRLIVLCHTWGGKPHNSTKEVANILKRYKNLRFIMGHSAPGETDEAIRLAVAHGNAYLDLCDIHRHGGMVEKMVNRAGADKVLFGTDMPWYDPNYCIGSILCAKITDGDKEKIFYKNAENLLKSK